MHKYQLLRQRAEELRALLLEYSEVDSEVEHFMGLWMPWYERVQRREIRLPCYEYKLSIYFTNPDLSRLAERYEYASPRHALAEAVTSFSEAMRDSLSGPNYLAMLKAAGEEPSAVLDELPPPEEETPLPSTTPPAAKPWAIVKWFNKLVRKRDSSK
jgi:hypothetical protein